MQNDKKKQVESAEPSLNQTPKNKNKTSEDKCEVKTLKRKKGSMHANDDTGRGREETFKTVLRSSFFTN